MGDLQTLVDEAERKCLDLWKRGPVRTTWSSLPPQAGDRAPDLSLIGSGGESTQLSSYWQDGPAAILFWRHFGCGCGMERAQRLRDEYDDYINEGATVVIVGQGDYQRAEEYAVKFELPPLDVLVDPDESAYQRYGLLEGKPSQVVFDAPEAFQRGEYEVFARLAEERRKGGNPLVDNPWLLPGEFVVDQKGVLRLTYRYHYCEDFPDHRVLLTSIREARWACA